MASTSSNVPTPSIVLCTVNRRKWPVSKETGTSTEYEPSPLKLTDQALAQILGKPGVQATYNAAKQREALHSTGGEEVLLVEVPLDNAHVLEKDTNEVFKVTKVQFLKGLDRKGKVLVYWSALLKSETCKDKPKQDAKKRKHQSTSRDADGADSEEDEAAATKESENINNPQKPKKMRQTNTGTKSDVRTPMSLKNVEQSRENLQEQIRQLKEENDKKDREIERINMKNKQCQDANAAAVSKMQRAHEKTRRELVAKEEELQKCQAEKTAAAIEIQRILLEKDIQIGELKTKASAAERQHAQDNRQNQLERQREQAEYVSRNERLLQEKNEQIRNVLQQRRTEHATAITEMQQDHERTCQEMLAEHAANVAEKERLLQQKEHQLNQWQIADAHTVNEMGRALNDSQCKLEQCRTELEQCRTIHSEVENLKTELRIAEDSISSMQRIHAARTDQLKKRKSEAENKYSELEEKHEDLKKENDDLKKKMQRTQRDPNVDRA